jgi:hypothetical protein
MRKTPHSQSVFSNTISNPHDPSGDPPMLAGVIVRTLDHTVSVGLVEIYNIK